MAVGTSLGQLFDDDFHYYQNQHDPDKFPSTGELKPADTGDNNTLTPKGLEGNKNQATDPDLVTPISDRLLVTRDNPPNPSYDTQLTPEQKTTYDSRYGGDANRDYDMQGYFKANPDVMPNAEGQHYPDTYKKPNHPTFSDESIYHGVDGNQGGHWGQEDGKDTFTPGPTNMQNWGKQGLQDYFQRVEPDVKLKDALPDFTNDRPHDWVERTAIAAGKAFQLPGDVLSGKVQPGSIQEIERAADLAGLMVGGPAPVASKMADGTLGSFAGVTSKTIDKTKLYEAQQMALDKTHPDEIWQKTGFFKGTDDRWRYEIPDEKAGLGEGLNHLITPATEGSNGMGSWTNIGGREAEHTVTLKSKKDELLPLPDVLNHPDLYKAYPSMKNIMVAHVPDTELAKGIKGMMDSRNDTLYLAPNLHPEYAKSVILHELQHNIQEQEGFARGGNVASFTSPILLKLESELDKLKTKVKTSGITTRVEADAINDATRIIQEHKQQAHNNYKRLAGEVEARNVQSRMDFNEVKRWYNSPRNTEDTPRFAQSTSANNGTASMADIKQMRSAANDNLSPEEWVSKFKEDLPKYRDSGEVDLEGLRKYIDEVTKDKNLSPHK